MTALSVLQITLKLKSFLHILDLKSLSKVKNMFLTIRKANRSKIILIVFPDFSSYCLDKNSPPAILLSYIVSMLNSVGNHASTQIFQKKAEMRQPNS